MQNIDVKQIPVNIEFEFCPYEWYETNSYSFKLFSSYDDEFAKFVFHNRVNNINGDKHHLYNIIFGGMSDNVTTLLIQKYKMGEITKDEVIMNLRKSTSVKQTSIHKQDLCDKIRPIRAYCIETGEELNVNDYFKRK